MKHKISKTAFWGNTGEPNRYANPKQSNGKTVNDEKCSAFAFLINLYCD